MGEGSTQKKQKEQNPAKVGPQFWAKATRLAPTRLELVTLGLLDPRSDQLS